MSRYYRNAVGTSLGYFAVLELLLVGAILFWPQFFDNIAKIGDLVPIKAVQEMLGQVEEGGIAMYIAGQHFFKGCNTVGILAAVLFAAGAIAGEVHRGTFEIFLARPYSRRRMLLERYFTGMAQMAVPIFVSGATIPWLSTYVDEDVALAPMMLSSVHQVLFLSVVYSLTFLFSTLGRAPVRIAFAVLIAVTFEFATYFIEKATNFSVFRLVDMRDFYAIYQTGSLDWAVCAPLLATSVALLLASLFVFERRVP